MNVLNAISKVRFASARPQRVQLGASGDLSADLLCFEPGQALAVSSGRRTYYLITGSLTVRDAAGAGQPLPAGGLAVPDAEEAHNLLNEGETRAVCLCVRCG